jgi:hypothetical protein
MADNINNNPDQGVGLVNDPQLDNSVTSLRLYPHVFPANKGAWSRFRGPLPQLGSVLEIFKKPS